MGRLRLKHIEYFSYRRQASLQHLVKLVHNRFYSTFAFYSEQELQLGIEGFQRRIVSIFNDQNSVEWLDANVMIVLQSIS